MAVLGLQVVKVNKAALLEKVTANREKHHGIFLEAVKGYRVKVIEVLEARLEDAKRGRRIRTYIDLPVPVDQTREYDKVIAMLQMSVDEQVELTQTEFSQYVMDDWSWKKQFSGTNSLYTASAAEDSPVDDAES